MHDHTVECGHAGSKWSTSLTRSAILFGIAAAVTIGGFRDVQAATPSYKFAEVGWLWIDPDGAGSESGVFLGGSWGTRRLQFFAEYGDPGDPEIWNIGAGWHGLLGDKADVVAEIAYVDAEVDDGFRIAGGVRWMVLERLEINGFLTYSDLDLLDTTGLSVGGIWDFTRRLGVGGTFEFGDNVDTARAFLRFNFGKR